MNMASFRPLFVIERRLHGGQSYLRNVMYDNCYSQSPSPRPPVLMYFYIPTQCLHIETSVISAR